MELRNLTDMPSRTKRKFCLDPRGSPKFLNQDRQTRCSWYSVSEVLRCRSNRFRVFRREFDFQARRVAVTHTRSAEFLHSSLFHPPFRILQSQEHSEFLRAARSPDGHRRAVE